MHHLSRFFQALVAILIAFVAVEAIHAAGDTLQKTQFTRGVPVWQKNGESSHMSGVEKLRDMRRAAPMKRPLPVKKPTPVQTKPVKSTPASEPIPEPTPDPIPAPVPEPVPAEPEKNEPEPEKGAVLWSCDFEGTYCGMHEQSKVAPEGKRRSSFVPTARSGSSAVMLTTLPGDNEVNGSGYWERNDLQLNPSADYCNAGQEEWWALSVLFPDTYVVPQSGGVVMDFHHKASGGQANFHFNSQPYGLQMRGYYGEVRDPGEYRVDLGVVERNVWYDLVYHVKWSEGEDGHFTAWMNGKKVLEHKGPTLYKGIPCYLKLANYHDPFGKSSSIIFDRVIRGTSASSVALSPLEGIK